MPKCEPQKVLQLRLEDDPDIRAMIWVIHDPITTDDCTVCYENGEPVEAGNYLKAQKIAEETYPDYIIERV